MTRRSIASLEEDVPVDEPSQNGSEAYDDSERDDEQFESENESAEE